MRKTIFPNKNWLKGAQDNITESLTARKWEL